MKKQVHVPLCAFLLLCGHLTAQPVQWIKHWGGSDLLFGSGHSGLAITTGPNGLIYGTGRLGRSIGFDGHFLTKSGDDDILVICWDSLGSALWARNYGAATTNDQPNFEAGEEIAYDPINQRVIIGGIYHDEFTIGSDTVQGALDNKSRFVIAALDASGQPIWSRAAVGNNMAELMDLASDAAGNVFAFGFLSGIPAFYGDQPYYLQSGGFEAKISPTGELLHARRAMISGSISAASFRDNDTWILAGETTNTGVLYGQPLVMPNINGNHSYVAEVDTNGTMHWAVPIQSHYHAAIQDCIYAADGNIYFYGFYDYDLYIQNDTLLSADPQEYFLGSLTGTGQLRWIKGINETELRGGWIPDFAVDTAGNSYVSGCFEDTLVVEGDTITVDHIYPAFVSHFDSNGNVLGVWNYGPAFYPPGVCVTDQGSLLVSGTYFNEPLEFGLVTVPLTDPWFDDIFLAKVPSLEGFTAISRAAEQSDALHIYANPNNGLCTIELPQSLRMTHELVLSVFDNTGQLVQRLPLTTGSEGIKLDIRAQAKGIYHVELGDGEQRYSGSIVFE
jgi:hypothetical protein